MGSGQPKALITDHFPLTTVLDSFGKARLLTFDRDPITRTPTVELAHEALLREWPRLRAWLDESRADIRQQRALAQAAAEWAAGNHDASFLLAGARLAQFEGWRTTSTVALTPDERAYYDASMAEREAQAAAEAERQRRELVAAQMLAEAEKRRAEEQARNAARLRRRAFYLAGALGAALLLLIAVIWFAQQASRNLGLAQSANTQAVGEVESRSTAEAQAQDQRNSAQAAQATAQSEAWVRATAEADAVQARTHAEQQAALASARELDAAAELQLAIDPQLSLLLALQAISVTRAAGLGDPLDVQQTLHDVMPAQRLLWSQKVPYWAIKTAYSADGRRIIFSDGAGYSDTTYIIDAQTRQTLLAVPGVGFALSPDETLLATSVEYDASYIWDAATGQKLITLTINYWDTAFDFSPDGNILVTGGNYVGKGDGLAHIWDLRAWYAAGRPAGVTFHQPSRVLGCFSQTNWYGGVNFSPDGQRLVAVCDKDNTAKVWDMATGREMLSLKGHASWVSDVDFSPDGTRLATTSVDGTARLWDAATGQELLRLNPGRAWVYNLAFSPDGQYLATSSEELAVIWDSYSGARLFELPNPGTLDDLAFSPDGLRLMTTLNGWLQEWDVSRLGPGELVSVPRDAAYAVDHSRDGSRFASIPGDGTLRVYESATLQELWRAQIFTDEPSLAGGLSFSADNTLLSSSVDNLVTVWNAGSGQKLFDLVQDDSVWAAAIRPDGLRLAAALANGRIALWDLTAREPLQTLSTTLACLFAIKFSPDGTQLAVGGARSEGDCEIGGWVYVWDLTVGTEGAQEPQVLRIDNRAIYSLDFSPDGRRLAVAGENGASVWEWASAKPVLTMTTHNDTVNDINYSPDGRHLVTASFDQTAKVWDAQTGLELLSYALPGDVTKAFFASEGQKVVLAAAGPRSFRLNAFDFEILLAAARARLVRGWRPAECQKYLHGPCP